VTRISPGRARRSSGDSVLLDARWRVGQGSALTVAIEAGPDARSASVAVRTPDGAEHIVPAILDGCAGEWTVRAQAAGGIPAFTLSCIFREDAPALVVTDLPARLGLMGGTYEIEPQRS